MKRIKVFNQTSAKELAMLFSGAKIPIKDMEEMILEFALNYAIKYHKEKVKFEDGEIGPENIGWNNGEFYKE